MSQNGSTVFRILSVLVLIAVVIGGGYMAFQAGQAQGYSLGAASGSAPVVSGEKVEGLVPFGYPGMMRHHFFPYMGFFGFIPMLIGLCIVFWLFRIVFWGPRHMHHHGPWGYGPYMHYPWPGEHPCGDPEKGPQQQPSEPDSGKK
jgi:hypothetical protein